MKQAPVRPFAAMVLCVSVESKSSDLIVHDGDHFPIISRSAGIFSCAEHFTLAGQVALTHVADRTPDQA
jgi:hypothetical protein